jgi:predicted nucleic acid-binding protein
VQLIFANHKPHRLKPVLHERVDVSPPLNVELVTLKDLNILEDEHQFAETVSNALPLARECGLSACDAAYLDVAVRHGAPLATLDAAFQKAACAADIKIFKV